MSEGNRLERNGDLVRKYFASHMDFSQESKLYDKLNGTGLCPEVTLQYDGFIEKKYVEGPTFAELFAQYSGDPQKLAGLFETFCDWYGKFREYTNLLLGNLEPAKFILTDHGFVYIDFEHCRPGFGETDLAHLIGWMCKADESAESSAARLFVCVCSSKLKLNPDRLEKALKKELTTAGEEASEDVSELIRFMTSAAVVVCRSLDDADVKAATSVFAAAPERYLCVPDGSASCPGFEVLTGSEGASLSLLSRKTAQPWLMVLFTGSDCAPDAPFFIRTEKVRELLPVPMEVDAKALLQKEQ